MDSLPLLRQANQGDAMNAPTPVKDALTLLSMALEDCDKATEGPWRVNKLNSSRSMGAWLAIDAAGYRVAQSRVQIRNYVGAGSAEWEAVDGAPSDAAFACLARAAMRPLLEYVQLWVRMYTGEGVAAITPEGWAYPPLAALRDHYEATRPDWRTR